MIVQGTGETIGRICRMSTMQSCPFVLCTVAGPSTTVWNSLPDNLRDTALHSEHFG